MSASLRTGSFYFGDGATKTTLTALVGDFLTVSIACAAILTAIAWYSVKQESTSSDVSTTLLSILFDFLIPTLSGMSFIVAAVITFRACTKAVCSTTTAKPGRKAILVASSAFVFAFSTFYRALNIASEGAALCRSKPTAFNAPITGRTIATFGEIALVVQASLFIEEGAIRLKTTRGFWDRFCTSITHTHFSTVIPVFFAEIFSWSGVLRLAGESSSLFFCAEYLMWMLIAFTWAWDCAELLHKSTNFMDSVSFCVLMLTGIILFFFNAVLELPHFFSGADRDSNTPGLWACVQKHDSPLWKKRLPFFVMYFIGASWIATAGAYRFLRTINYNNNKDKDKTKNQ